MVQFGYLILFSPCFTLAPLFSLFTNLLEIRIKLDSMGKYSRRYKADSTDGIGIWLSIMEFLTFLAVPVNIGIVVFTGFK
jgi:anoctamin-10